MASKADAEALAAKLSGKTPESEALAMIIAGAKEGTYPDDADDSADEGGEDEYDTDADDDGDDEQDTDPNDGEGDEADDPEDQADEDEDDNSSESDDGDEGDEYETAEYREDDVFDVTVDGVQQEVTLKELLQRYSGEGAIDKRLQEATELRKTAQAEREAASAEIETHRTNLLQTIAKLDHALFMPLVKKPDPALRQTNMQEYLLQQDAYQEDQSRIQQLRNGLSTMFNEEKQRAATARETFRKEQGALLVKAAPELSNPETAKVFQDDLMTAVSHYGVTQQQLAEVDNHVLFLMARDAGRWIKMQKAKAAGAKQNAPKGGEAPRKRRRLKAGGATAHATTQKNAKVVKLAETKARKTGSVDDVANMLAVNANAKLKRR